MSYSNILHTFWVGCKIWALFFQPGEIDIFVEWVPGTQNKKMYQHLWYQLKVTIKGFNVDTYYFISGKYEMYNN